MTPQELLRHHVTGAIERGEKEAIVGQPTAKWYLVILDRTVLGVYGAALLGEALAHRNELANGTHQLASVVGSATRFHVGERLPNNARISYHA